MRYLVLTTAFCGLLGSCASVGKAEKEVAKDLTEVINLLDDHIEHGALIFCPEPKKCYASEVVSGEKGSVDLGPLWPQGYGTDLVTAIIHSHPPYYPDESNFIGDMMDSINTQPSQQDYYVAYRLREQGKKRQRMTLYIIGPDNVLRDYLLPTTTIPKASND